MNKTYPATDVIAAFIAEPATAYGTPTWMGRLREGLPYEEFEALCAWTGLTAEVLSAHLTISRSTLARRRAAGKLDMLESDRLLRFARLFARAVEVLGGAEAAGAWMLAPARSFEYESPWAMAETEAGAREVEYLLGRLETGVYA